MRNPDERYGPAQAAAFKDLTLVTELTVRDARDFVEVEVPPLSP